MTDEQKAEWSLIKAITKAGYAECHVTCYECTTGIVARSWVETMRAFKKHGFQMIDGKAYCPKHLPQPKPPANVVEIT